MGKTIDLSEDAQVFLFYSYFGSSYSKLKNYVNSKNESKAIEICFRTAYLDFSRTMSFKEKGLEDDFPGEIYNGIYKEKNLYSMIIEILNDGPEKFEANHENICDAIVCLAGQISYIEEKNGEKNFSYGQAQKWLNMTLKYMYLTGLWKNKFSKVGKSIHIPLDNYILKMVLFEENREKLKSNKLIKESNESVTDKFNFANKYGSICFSTDEFGNITKDSELCKVENNRRSKNTAYVTWSNLKYYNNYKAIQEKIKECIPDGISPLEWENKVWIESSEL